MRAKVLTFGGMAITVVGLFLYLSPYITSPTRTGDHYVYALQHACMFILDLYYWFIILLPSRLNENRRSLYAEKQ